ncbi:response regulator [Alphaproteobacteria bacterium GH1-50]|uniref:Response regulator n=1 Tax=Kangsaoukella pontilimi TaxID=2691042 RepID=A0A7C9IPA3_9RHOB|nr:response regulator [Kangsaoukella pontilimi]MXQ06723.1 response regulator [Kangsaoukella pontilimi]
MTDQIAQNSQEVRPSPLSTAAIRAVILDDNAVDRRRIQRLCREADIEISFTEVSTIAEFASKIDQAVYDLFFLDYRLVQGDGLIALEMLKRHPNQKRAASIMVAGEGQIQVAIDAMKAGCRDFLIKDMMGPDMMSRAVLGALSRSAAAPEEPQEPSALQVALARFAIGSGAEMRTILSSMLRHTRGLRHKAVSPDPILPEDLDRLEANSTRLWEFLEEFQSYLAGFNSEKRRLH